MDAWQVEPARLRALRERAELRVTEIADLLGCHHGHYRKFERGTAQPSTVLAYGIVRVLSGRLQREIEFSDFAVPVPSRRRSAA